MVEAVRSIRIKGSAASGFNGVTGKPLQDMHPFEVRAKFPGQYLRIEESQGTRRFFGYRDELPVARVMPLSDDVRVAQPNPDKQFVAGRRALWTRLLLGFFADAKGVLHLTYRRETGGTIKASGPDGFIAWVDIDDKGVPLRVRYLDTVFFVDPLSEADRKSGKMNQPRPERTEVTLHFEDRRSVKGLLLPHLIRRTAKGTLFETIHVRVVELNPSLTADDFLPK